MTNIDETELARLEELAAKALTLPFEDMAADGWGYVVVDILPAVTTAVPALIAEIRRLRAEAKQGGIDYCALMDRHDAQFVRAEDLKKQVEDLQWFVECFDNCKQRGKLPLEVHKTPSAYSEAWASLWAAREAVHADRE